MSSTIFPKTMLDSKTKALTLDCIVMDMTYYQEQLQLLHWTTTSYSAHKAIDKLHENVQSIRDEVVERIIGYSGVRPKSFKINPLLTTVTPTEVATMIISFATQLQDYGKTNNMPDIENLAQALSGHAAQTKYLLTLS